MYCLEYWSANSLQHLRDSFKFDAIASWNVTLLGIYLLNISFKPNLGALLQIIGFLQACALDWNVALHKQYKNYKKKKKKKKL